MLKSAEGKEYLVQFHHTLEGMIFKSHLSFFWRVKWSRESRHELFLEA